MRITRLIILLVGFGLAANTAFSQEATVKDSHIVLSVDLENADDQVLFDGVANCRFVKHDGNTYYFKTGADALNDAKASLKSSFPTHAIKELSGREFNSKFQAER